MKQQSGKEKLGPSTISSTGDIFDRIGHGMVCLDNGLILTYVNDTASRLLQKQRDELTGLGLLDAVPGPLGTRLREAVLKVLDEGADTGFQEHSPAPQGHLLDVHCLPTDEGTLVVFHRAVKRNRRGKAYRNNEPPSGGRRGDRARNVRPGIEHAFGYTPADEPRWKNRELLQAVLKNVPSGLLVADRSGRIIVASEAVKEIFGESASGTTYGPDGGYRLMTLDGSPFPPDDLPLRRSLQKGEPSRGVEILVRRRDGSKVVILASASPLRGRGGAIIGAITVLQDITARKRTEESLRENEERLRLAQQAGGVGIFDWDIPGDRVYWSDEGKKILGIPKNNIHTDEAWRTLVHPEDFQRTKDEMEQAVLEHKSVDEGEFRVMRPDGEVRWLSGRGVISYDTAGKPVRMIGAAVDITRLKNAQASLETVNEELEKKVQDRTRELEEANRMLRAQKDELLSILDARRKMERDMIRLTTAVDQAGEGIALFDTGWIIEYVNPAYERLSGYTRKDLLGRSVDFLRKDFVTEFYPDAPYTVATRGETWRGTARRRKKCGEMIDIHLTVSPVRDQTGKIVNYVGVIQDISKLVRLQHMIAQSQKLEAIGTLAGGIAHDLKNIFTPILLNAEIAVEDVGRDNPAHPLLEEIQEAARLGVDLVKQIMTFTRQTSEEKIPMDISPAIQETLSLLRSAIPKTINIITRFRDEELKVWANPTQIKQVLMNLGSNAAHAMRGKTGLLEVNVAGVDLDENAAASISPGLPSGSYVEVAVRDTGEGMDETTQQRIFDPFFTTKRHGEGTGMGLSVVRGIIRDHRGTVSVWSRPGQGSIFKVLLPRLENQGLDGKPAQ